MTRQKRVSVFVLIGLVALLLLLTSCSQKKLPGPLIKQLTPSASNQTPQPAVAEDVQITPEEEADEVDQAIIELEETDSP